MASWGTFDQLRATCTGVIDGLPTSQVAEARRRAETALAELHAVADTSDNPHHRRAVESLETILADLDTIDADLLAARDHATVYRTLLE